MSTTTRNTLLIAGASGVIGAGALEHFSRLPDWDVIALSRRAPTVSNACAFTHISVELTDADVCRRAIADLPPISHMIYAAVAEAPGLIAGWQDNARIKLNGAMFENLLAPLAESGHLRHVSIMQGAKAYGAHLHPVPIPLRENFPRDPHANFYWLHEDALRASAASHGFAFTIWRPQILIGTAPGAAMNPVLPIAAYAAICRERGLGLALPGSGTAILELVDTGLLAEALHWAATDSAAKNQTFNITNGDAFVLRDIWDGLTASMGHSWDGTAPPDFAQFFKESANQQAWRAIAVRHNLREPSLAALLGQSHHYLDVLNSARLSERAPVLLSTIKLRQAGFTRCRDSQSSVIALIRTMRELRLVPPLFI